MKSSTLSKNSNFVPAVSMTTRSPPKRRSVTAPDTRQMSDEIRDFIQKICYRKSASIDMTQYGFIADSKSHLVNLMLKPLRAKLEKICGTPLSLKHSPLVRSNSAKTPRSPDGHTRRTSPNRQNSPKRSLSPKFTSPRRSRSPKRSNSPRSYGSPRYSPESILRDVRPSISYEKLTLAMETSLSKRKKIMKTIQFALPLAPTNSKILRKIK